MTRRTRPRSGFALKCHISQTQTPLIGSYIGNGAAWRRDGSDDVGAILPIGIKVRVRE
jgi:hypothetical protein